MKAEGWRNKKRSTEGSIRIVGKNIYARIQWIDERTGARKEKSRRAQNRTEARGLIKEMIAELRLHGEQTLDADKLTFSQLAKEYLAKRVVQAVYSNGIKVTGKRSILPTRSAIRSLTDYFGNKKVRTIRASDIESYKTNRLATPVVIRRKSGDIVRQRRMSSINRELEHLRAMFNFAKADGLIIQNPFETKGQSLIVKGAENERDRVLSKEEEDRLIQACGPRTMSYTRNGRIIEANDDGRTRTHVRALIVVAVDTGARRGELFKLRWRDVDLRQRVITIQASNSKTEKKRIVGLTTRAKSELQSLWNESAQCDDDLVFGIVSTIKTSWKSLCRAAAISDLTFHDLRHTATTRMIRAGVPHTEVMKITGHTQIKTFLRYLNMTNESLMSSVSKLDDYLTQQRSPIITTPDINDFVN